MHTRVAWQVSEPAPDSAIFIHVAVIISMQVRENLAKIAVLPMGVTVFAYIGYEHVIANSARFMIALLFEPDSVSLLHIGKNFVFSLLGSYVGGGLVIGPFYAQLNDNRGVTLDANAGIK